MAGYRWKRASDKYPSISEALNGIDIHSRTNGNTSFTSATTASSNGGGDVWARKVAAATDQAVAKVSGKSRSRSKRGLAMKFENLDADDVYIEDESVEDAAKALLNQWMHDKVQMDNGSAGDTSFDCDIIDSANTAAAGGRNKSATNILDDLEQQLETLALNDKPVTADERRNEQHSRDIGECSSSAACSSIHGMSALDLKLEELEEKYELLTVDKILDNIVNKQFDDNKHVLNNLGFRNTSKPKPASNLLTKMELRQQEMLAKKAERLKKAQEKNAKDECSAETETAARKMIMEEEKELLARKAEEEKRIREDMEKIRKDLHEQQNMMKEQLRRENQLKEAAAEKRKLQEQSLKQQQTLEKMKLDRVREENKRKLAQKMEQVKVKQMRCDLQCLHKHFCAWYDFVLEHRLKMGKAIALFEWRVLCRTWNTWKSATVSRTVEREALRHKEDMKRNIQREHFAVEHNKRRIMQRCLKSWQLFVTLVREERAVEAEAELRKKRLEEFLKAASTGDLWKNDSGDITEDTEMPVPSHRLSSNDTHSVVSSKRSSAPSTNTTARVHRMFDSAAPGPTTGRSTSSIASAGCKIPREPWQVRRNHVHDLTVEQLTQLGQSTKKAISESAKQLQTKLNEKQLEQKKQLEEQQKQLKNQQKMIQQLQKQIVSSEKVSSRRLSDVTESEVLSSNSPGSSRRITSPSMRDHRETDDPTNEAIGSGTSRRSGASSSAKSAGAAVPHDPIVAAMEERERVRQEKRAKFEAAKRQKERDKMALLKLEQEEMEAALLQEKKAAAEKRRQEALEQQKLEKQKLENQAAFAAARAKADEFNVYRLIKFYGLKPWMKLMTISRNNQSKADGHFATVISRKCFHAWRTDSMQCVKLKNEMSTELYNYLLIRRYFSSWCRYGEIMAIEAIKADRHYRCVLKRKVLLAWCEYTDERRTHNLMNAEVAEKHNEERLQRRCFLAWKKLPAMTKAEAEKLKRRSELRNLVSEILPDFHGASMQDSSVMESTDLTQPSTTSSVDVDSAHPG